LFCGLLYLPERYRSLNGLCFVYATEVIREAIHRMQADDDRAAAFRRAIGEGEVQLDRGQGGDYTRKGLNEIADTVRR